MTELSGLELGAIIAQVLGGLALFLFGMEQMTAGLKVIAGHRLKTILAWITSNRFKSALTGMVLTALVQSSSVTTVMLVGFISAGLLPMPQAMGFILGADIGSTLTTQIIAFRITGAAFVFIAVGFALHLGLRKHPCHYWGVALLGLGLVFFGMEIMSSATLPLRDYAPFISWMSEIEKPWAGILLGTLVTAIIQSSAATAGLVIVLAGQGFLNLETGIAIVLGANIGTCATALLAAIGKPRPAVQAAFAHVLFKVLGVLIWYPLIDDLALIVRGGAPVIPPLAGLAQHAAESGLPRQIANAHTLFNVANALLFIWFTKPMAWLVRKLIPDNTDTTEQSGKPRYLNNDLLVSPGLALDCVRLELTRLGKQASTIVHSAPTIGLQGTAGQLAQIAAMDDGVDCLHEAIVGYLAQLTQQDLTNSQATRLYQYLSIANYFENIGDAVETNLVAMGMERLERSITIQESAYTILEPLYGKIRWAVDTTVASLEHSDDEQARAVIQAKDGVYQLARQVRKQLVYDLPIQNGNGLGEFRIESDIVEYLKRIYYFSRRICKTVHAELSSNQQDREEPTTSEEQCSSL